MPATKKRPTAVLVVAILLIVFGGWNLFGGCCGGFGIAMTMFGPVAELNRQNPQGNPAGEIENQLAARFPLYLPLTFGSLAITFLAGAGLLASGIGLLRMRPWARSLSLVVSAIVILDIIGMNLYQLLVINPVRGELMQQAMGQLPPNMRGIIDMAQYAGAVFGLFLVGVMIAIMVMLTRPTIRDALNRPADAADAAADLDDDYDRPRRADDDDDYDDRLPPSTGIRPQ